ncbi:MAG: hypothetical protein H6561_21140 [Lewinellaceae bacterium]|nr:hypothetical protein [Lewinellaceae bacterium]
MQPPHPSSVRERCFALIKVTDKIEDATDPNIAALRQQASAQPRSPSPHG